MKIKAKIGTFFTIEFTSENTGKEIIINALLVFVLINSFITPFWIIPEYGSTKLLINLLSYGFIASLLIVPWVIWSSRKNSTITIFFNSAITILIVSYIPMFLVSGLIAVAMD